VSKRRDSCLSGSSPLELPEKVRGMEEKKNDNFRIELEDDELQREEMEEMEMEMEEKEMEKEREEDVEVEQREEEGELPFRDPKPPFSNQQGFTCTRCLSTNDDTAYPFCVCCGVKDS
jgi:hypothetical protein